MATLELFYPLSNVIVTQRFGINGEYYRANGIQTDGHNGIDMLAYHGQPIYAPMDGTAYYQEDAKEGHGVVIISDTMYAYKGAGAYFKAILWHFCDPEKEGRYESPIYVACDRKINSGVGIKVKAGDLVGFADSTGLSTGDHLHFGLKPIKSGRAPSQGDMPDIGIGEWVNIEQKNGYMGAIDPEPYFNGQFRVNTLVSSPFQRDLYLGISGKDVQELQKYLNRKGYVVAKSGAGSKGKETEYYGSLTQAAVRKLQMANGIYPTAGYFGSLTRAWVAKNP